MSNPQMYELSPKALTFLRDAESRYSKSHMAMAQLALAGGDSELLANPHLRDYADTLLPTLLDYDTAIRQSRDNNAQIAAMGRDTLKRMTPDIKRLCSLVNAMHAVDVGPREIANRKFAESRLVPLITGSSN